MGQCRRDALVQHQRYAIPFERIRVASAPTSSHTHTPALLRRAHEEIEP